MNDTTRAQPEHIREARPLCVAYVVDSFPKRSETFVRDEVEWVAKRGELDRVFALQSETEALAEVSEDVRSRIRLIGERSNDAGTRWADEWRWQRTRPGRFWSRLQARSMSRESREWFQRGVALAELLREAPLPDIMHVHFAGASVQIARYASQLTGVPFVCCAHHYDIFHSGPPNFPVLGHDAAMFTTISDYNRRYLIDEIGLDARKIRVIHCGIDGTRFRRAETADNIADDKAPLRLVSVGRLTEIKAQQYQIEAARRLADQGVAFRLRIIGEGDRRDALQQQIDTLGLAEHVELRGAQPSHVVIDELRHADVFVMSSLSEGIPVALMEAMAMRLPVVTTGVRGIPELVEDGVSGRLVAVEDADALASAIAELADDSARRRQMGEAGRERVLRDFNAETEYRRLNALWRALAA